MQSLTKYLLLCAIFARLISLGQAETFKWCFGDKAGLDFSTSPPTAFTHTMWAGEGSASISDSQGNLLFYTNNQVIYNKLHQVMANGSFLTGNTSATQGALIVKWPGTASRYFVFHMTPGPTALYYSVVDMALAAGNGSVISKNNNLGTVYMEKLVAARHCNGVDTWVLAHKNGSADFHAFLITSGGIITTPTVSTVGVVGTTLFAGWAGYLKVSPNGRKLGAAYYENKLFEIYDFDNTTGLVSNAIPLGTVTGAYGCEFSPDGSKFYGDAEANIFNPPVLYQWDLCAGNAAAIVASVYTLSVPEQIMGMQLANDGKIYVTNFNDTIPVIANPNAQGAACNYVHKGQSIFPNTGLLGMPNFISAFFEMDPPAYTHSVGVNLGCQTASFSVPTAPNPTGTACTALGYSLAATEWNFGDPSSGANNISFLNNPTHFFSAFGTYTVQLVMHYSCGGANDTLQQVVVIDPPPPLNITLSSSSLCAQALNGSANTITFTASGATTYTLYTSPPVSTGNLSNGTVQISTAPPYVPTGVASATLFGKHGVCTASMSTTFSIIPNPLVSVSDPTPVICAGQSYTYTSSGATSYTWSATTPNYTTYSNGGVAVTNPSINSVFTVYGSSLNCQSALVTSTLTVLQIPAVAISPSAAAICRNSSVALEAIGTATLYNWTPAPGLNQLTTASVSAGPLTTQIFTVTGSIGQCTAAATTTITVLDLPSPEIASSSTVACLGDKITLNGKGGVVYEWRGPGEQYYQGVTTDITMLNPARAGTYTLTVADTNGCKNSTTVVLGVDVLPTGGLTGPNNGCAPFCGDFVATGFNDSLVASTWRIGDETFPEKFSYCFTQPGEHVIIGNFSSRTTSCRSTQSFVIIAHEKPVADFVWRPLEPVEGYEVNLLNRSTGEDQNNWNWYIDNGSTVRFESENLNILFDAPGDKRIVYLVENKWGCSDTVIKILPVKTDFVIYVPSAFTPNEDGTNEVFKPVMRGVKEIEFRIFNRWGEQLYATSSLDEGWDGRYKNVDCKQDTYVWKVSLKTTEGSRKELNGRVLLYR